MRADELKRILESMPLQAIDVIVDTEGSRYVAVVTSPDFDGMDNGSRQGLVWQWLHEKVPMAQIPLIEFVFTWTPGEKARYERTPAQGGAR